MKNKKRVVFVAGGNHTGSTLVGCVLGANEKSAFEHFHVGEAHAFFKHDNARFGDPRRAAQMGDGAVWHKISHTVGYKKAYSEIFSKIPSMRTLIDSSKTASNLKSQLLELPKNRYEFQCVLTFKSFDKMWLSGKVRNKPRNAIRDWILDYEKILRLLRDHNVPFTVVKVTDFIGAPSEQTKLLCKFCSIPYFPKKEEYWKWPFAHLYGAGTQRKHFLDPATGGYDIGRTTNRDTFVNDFLRSPRVISIESDLNELYRRQRGENISIKSR